MNDTSNNLRRRATLRQKNFGVRMRLAPDDAFRAVLGADWEGYRWYRTAAERDAALAELARQHVYSRQGDRPTLIYEKIMRNDPAAR